MGCESLYIASSSKSPKKKRYKATWPLSVRWQEFMLHFKVFPESLRHSSPFARLSKHQTLLVSPGIRAFVISYEASNGLGPVLTPRQRSHGR